MRVILDRNIFDFLDAFYQFTQEYRASDTCHIFDTDFVGTCFDKLLSDV